VSAQVVGIAVDAGFFTGHPLHVRGKILRRDLDNLKLLSGHDYICDTRALGQFEITFMVGVTHPRGFCLPAVYFSGQGDEKRETDDRLFEYAQRIVALPQKSEIILGQSQNHLAIAGGFAAFTERFDFVPPATARWF
jgi:hypothetical protein